jgi:hypothetical protein
VTSPLTGKLPAVPSTAPMSTGTRGKRAARGLSGVSAAVPFVVKGTFMDPATGRIVVVAGADYWGMVFVVSAIAAGLVVLTWIAFHEEYRRKVARLGEYDSSTRFYFLDVGTLCGGHATKPCAVFDESTGRVHVYMARIGTQAVRKELGRE